MSKTGAIRTNDGVSIRYTEAGSGSPLILLPGFSQTAAEFRKQIDVFAQSHRVLAVDFRGNGVSDKPAYGYRIARFAADLRDLILALDLRDVSVLAHSLASTVVWAYWDLYDGYRIRRLILVDEGPVGGTAIVPADEALRLGGFLTPEVTAELVTGLRGEGREEVARGLLRLMHTADLDPRDVDWLLRENLSFYGPHAASLLLDYAYSDWRDVLPRITVPTLVVGGELSHQAPEVAPAVAALIPGARSRVFTKDEKGSHLMFWENPDGFNEMVAGFLDEDFS
ncbi:alpha/beta hydrolase [Actinoplanes sp. TBRC 11911]|uniref:alpha/beta fold hydrolase n=1 Tax=Actinoplanes sp. TBRC 11911 TaxID=2729386 RepID=UPI00145CF819|nr:alpha/beta hydrolase [Actinoplanes sp. TBRC 11911]NMO57365.1 alpha/beta hydrolase [Actinoplanes sp. TBRC 11911]